MGVVREHGLGTVADRGCEDVERDSVGQRQRRVCMPEDVQASGRDAAAFRWRVNARVSFVG